MGHVILSGVSKGMTVPRSETPISKLAEGSLIKINENGSPVEFYVAKHDYESGLNGAGRTLVVRKDCYDNRAWHSSNVNAWASCTLRSWLNGTYKNLLDADIRGVIGTTKYYYIPGNGTTSVTTRSDAVFQLSVTELGIAGSAANAQGTALPIASTLQIAYRNGSAVVQWTRSPLTGDTVNAYCLVTNGKLSYAGCTITHGSRPAFTLPSTILVKKDGSVVV